MAGCEYEERDITGSWKVVWFGLEDSILFSYKITDLLIFLLDI